MFICSCSFFSVRVTSTGNSQTSPLCTAWGNCNYNDETKQECASALCVAQGYSGGTFVSSSNNFCTTSYANRGVWVYALTMGRQNQGQIKLFNSGTEAAITADCGKIVTYY